MTTVSSECDFYSIGQLAAHLQRSVRQIEETATMLNISPAMRLNGVPHFNGTQVEEIICQLKDEP